MDYSNKKTAVLGLGIEGKDVINFLVENGCEVTVFDKKEKKDLDLSGIDLEKIKLVTGNGYLDAGLGGFDIVVRSPGIYRYLPQITEAESNGVYITSAVRIFFDKSKAKIIGVTGTKGKGTTSTLIYEIMKHSGFDVYLSGNIGKPYLSLLSQITENSWVVLEMSSFQLIDLDLSPHIAVVLNITSDHMDWHKDIEEYTKSKKNIVANQSETDFAVVNFEYDSSRSFSYVTKAKVVPFSKNDLEEKYKSGLLLKGEHNLENIAAAVSVGKILGVSESEIKTVLQNFKGLEHRLEMVRTVGGITFYNDSFATGPQPTIAAIKSFNMPETIILGGSEKNLDYKELAEVLVSKENVKTLMFIGDTGPKIKTEIMKSGYKGKIFDLGKSPMNEIVQKAFSETEKGGVVILSPASASFDMFKNYKERGNQFKDCVNKLSNET